MMPNNWDQHRNQSRSIQDEMGHIKYQGEQVYCTPVQNALASRMFIDQLTPHLHKDNQEVAAHVKQLQAMLDTATVMDPTPNHYDEAKGHDHDH
jgi:hypothetical protein